MELDSIETIFYCDETKFSLNNNDPEDSIYYFAVSYEKSKTSELNFAYNKILENYGIDVFHATDCFKAKSPNENLMTALCNFITSNRINCFCFRYSKSLLYEFSKKHFNRFNNSVINFNNQEFQALYYFLVTFDIYLKENPNLIKPNGLLFFDRNVYGRKDIEAFNFNFESPLVRMVFVNKSKIDLLGLPDFFGYIFRKTKLSHNRVQMGDNTLETSPLVINSNLVLLALNQAKLFHFLDTDAWIDKINDVVELLIATKEQKC